jgi:hypothetical protein
MTIDDELLLKLFDPDFYGNLGEDALIANIVGTRLIDYTLEETKEVSFWRKGEIETMTPDIVVTHRQQSTTIAIELENDISWDFQKSLRQLKKYKKQFSEVRIIIPREYKRFAPLYYHEGFGVFLWSAKRKWKCLKCHHITPSESRIPPRCNGKTEDGKPCTNKNDFDLVGLESTKFEGYKPEDLKK